MTQPVFSIIVPTYDRPGPLTACLDALGRLDYPRDQFEVLVVNDGGHGQLDGILRAFQDRYDVTLLTQPHRGPAAARNTGAAHARGRFLAFTDDDCEPAPSWLRSLAACFAETSDCLIGGRVVNALLRNRYSATSQLLIDYIYSCQTTRVLNAPFFASNNMALPTTGFAALTGFDPTFPLPAAEDRDLTDRWLQTRRPILYAPHAVVYHNHVLTFQTFWRQHVRYGRGAARFHWLRARRSCTRVRLESPMFYLNLLRYPLTQAPASRVIPLLLLLTLSQSATAFGFFAERRKWRAGAPR